MGRRIPSNVTETLVLEVSDAVSMPMDVYVNAWFDGGCIGGFEQFAHGSWGCYLAFSLYMAVAILAAILFVYRLMTYLRGRKRPEPAAAARLAAFGDSSEAPIYLTDRRGGQSAATWVRGRRRRRKRLSTQEYSECLALWVLALLSIGLMFQGVNWLLRVFNFEYISSVAFNSSDTDKFCAPCESHAQTIRDEYTGGLTQYNELVELLFPGGGGDSLYLSQQSAVDAFAFQIAEYVTAFLSDALVNLAWSVLLLRIHMAVNNFERAYRRLSARRASVVTSSHQQQQQQSQPISRQIALSVSLTSAPSSPTAMGDDGHTIISIGNLPSTSSLPCLEEEVSDERRGSTGNQGPEERDNEEKESGGEQKEREKRKNGDDYHGSTPITGHQKQYQSPPNDTTITTTNNNTNSSSSNTNSSSNNEGKIEILERTKKAGYDDNGPRRSWCCSRKEPREPPMFCCGLSEQRQREVGILLVGCVIVFSVVQATITWSMVFDDNWTQNEITKCLIILEPTHCINYDAVSRAWPQITLNLIFIGLFIFYTTRLVRIAHATHSASRSLNRLYSHIGIPDVVWGRHRAREADKFTPGVSSSTSSSPTTSPTVTANASASSPSPSPSPAPSLSTSTSSPPPTSTDGGGVTGHNGGQGRGATEPDAGATTILSSRGRKETPAPSAEKPRRSFCSSLAQIFRAIGKWWMEFWTLLIAVDGGGNTSPHRQRISEAHLALAFAIVFVILAICRVIFYALFFKNLTTNTFEALLWENYSFYLTDYIPDLLSALLLILMLFRNTNAVSNQVSTSPGSSANTHRNSSNQTRRSSAHSAGRRRSSHAHSSRRLSKPRSQGGAPVTGGGGGGGGTSIDHASAPGINIHQGRKRRRRREAHGRRMRRSGIPASSDAAIAVAAAAALAETATNNAGLGVANQPPSSSPSSSTSLGAAPPAMEVATPFPSSCRSVVADRRAERKIAEVEPACEGAYNESYRRMYVTEEEEKEREEEGGVIRGGGGGGEGKRMTGSSALRTTSASAEGRSRVRSQSSVTGVVFCESSRNESTSDKSSEGVDVEDDPGSS